MNYIKEKIKDFYLRDSQIENIFINEYMPAAPGDYVKVFIYGYMYAEFGMEMNNSMMSRQLGISEKKIDEAWTYWEQMGAIRKLYFDEKGNVDFTVEFLNLKELMYGKSTETIPEAESQNDEVVFGNEKLKEAFVEIEKLMERSLSSAEVKKIINWVVDEHIRIELLLYCINYCKERDKLNMRYIETVIHNWVQEGLTTVEDVSLHLQETDQRFYQYKRVMKALGFNRSASEAEKKMMDKWFDEYGYTMDRILSACDKTAGISSPNFNYVNKVLQNWKAESEKRGTDINKEIKVSNSDLKKYFEYLRRRGSEEAEQRTREVYTAIPRIQDIDSRTRELGTLLSKALIRGDNGEQAGEIRQQMMSLSEERAFLLTENEFEMNYTDVRYHCDICHDTGITDAGEQCKCIPERLEEAEIWLKTQGSENG